MTDRELAVSLAYAQAVETLARAHWDATQAQDLAERDPALVAVRHATALRKTLERWSSARLCRAALQK